MGNKELDLLILRVDFTILPKSVDFTNLFAWFTSQTVFVSPHWLVTALGVLNTPEADRESLIGL